MELVRGKFYAIERVAGRAGNRYVASARSHRTWVQYASAVTIFEAFCAENRLCAMPATSETLLAWVIALADQGKAYSTIAAYLQAVATQHKIAGHRVDRTPLSETLRGIRRQADRPRQARPLLGEELRGILAMLDPKNPRDVRDGALLSLGWAAALRRSEIVELDWVKQCSDVRRRGNGVLRQVLRQSDRGLQVVLNKAKTSQDKTVRIDIPQRAMRSAFLWVRLWNEIAQLAPGEPVFRAVDKAGNVGFKRLSGGALGMILRHRIFAFETRNGIESDSAAQKAENYTGHSLRAGYATTAARAGVHEWKIRSRMRHADPRMTAGYVRAAEDEKENGIMGIGF